MMDASSVSIPIRQDTPHRVFALAILLKRLNGSLELIAGFGLLPIGPNALQQFVTLWPAIHGPGSPASPPQAHAFATIYEAADRNAIHPWPDKHRYPISD